jgi:serine/threonine-protein kinase
VLVTTARASVSNPTPMPSKGSDAAGASGEGMPRRFGKYTLIRKLANGGMAELYLALQRSVAGFEKLIVVKRVLPHLAQDQAFIELLLTEARIAATLSHPNIAHIYDVGEVDGQYYIAMEHIHGEDLRSIVKQMKKVGVSAFPLEHALAIVLGCGAGLAYAHEKRDLSGDEMNIVHRDVSPQNILCTFSGDVKLVDFGIAKAGRSTLEDTGDGQLRGKIPYMSPEQAGAQPLDARSDIFSLGIILFELCTGKRLFRGTDDVETLRMIALGEYPRPRSINPALHPRLEEIILRALEKDRSARYQSARDLQSDLEDHIREEQLKVSSISLGAWMQTLFHDKLESQREMLQEGRQLADVIAAQAAIEDESARISLTSSGVRQKSEAPPKRGPWFIVASLIALAVAGFAAFATMRPGVESTAIEAGSVSISSTPEGAAILLDGTRREERTPATIERLPLGRYAVTITMDGYAPFHGDIELTQENPGAEITATLERPSARALGMARVVTDPPGARVLLDGHDTGQLTPATVAEIEPGIQHTIVVSLDGWVAANVPLNVQAGALEEVRLTLERTPLGSNEHLVTITTDPPDARVQLDSAWHEGGSPYSLRVSARRYRLRVVRDGYRMFEREISLPGGQESTMRINLERERGRAALARESARPSTSTSAPGRVTIDARPWCNVTLDGAPLGQTPIVNRTVPSGTHTVSCTNPELGRSRTVQIEVAPGETSRTRITLD